MNKINKITDKLSLLDIYNKVNIGLEFEFIPKIGYYSVLEKLNNICDRNVHGFKEYHSDFKVTDTDWKLEPDLSGGFDMAELVTSPMSYQEARLYITKLLNLFKKIAKTSDKTGIHINISFKDKELNKISPLKLCLNIDESEIYDYFPTRKNNIYCKSVKNFIPYNNQNMSFLLNDNTIIPAMMSKYYGINFQHLKDNRIEFRYLGGIDYFEKQEEILELMDYFIQITYESFAPLNDKEKNTLSNHLDKKIEKLNNITDIESLLGEYPKLSIEIDKTSNRQKVASYYPKIYKDIYDLLSNIKIKGYFKINYDTESSKLEVINADILSEVLIDNTVFVNCTIKKGDYYLCDFHNCDIKYSIITKSNITSTEITESKLHDSIVDKYSKLINCYFSGGSMYGYMEKGVFRNGKIFDTSVIKDTEILDDNDNFFMYKGDEIKRNKKK